MKLRLKYLLEHLIQNILKVFSFIPIQKKRVLFSSFSGRQYSDSPKRISDELLKTHPQYEQIWAFVEPSKFLDLNSKGIKVIKFKSLSYLYYAMTCSVFVDNVEFWSILKFRPRQMVIQTWHGGGLYKRVGSDRMDVSELEKQHVINKMKKNTLFISSCRKFTEFVIRGAFRYDGEVLEIGLPRNDELIREGNLDIAGLRSELGVPEGNKCVLYAPTFRNSMSVALYDVDFERLCAALSMHFGGEWTVILRLHYYMDKQKMNVKCSHTIVDATTYPDMQHLLRLADVLVTDYSSSLWDFSLMNKPAFVYARDLDEYCTERNFYMPIDQWPFPVATNNKMLEDNILAFCEERYCNVVHEHHTLLGITETGKATQLICKRIVTHIEEETI